MVARTGNSSAMTTSTNPTLSPANYFSSNFKMNLPQNLLHPIDSWSKQDVQKWIEYCIDEYSLGDVHLNDFEMNGKALLLLTEDNFKQRSSRSGDILHKALQQHRMMLKTIHCQTFPFPLWNNFPFSSISSPSTAATAATPTRRLDMSSSAAFSLPISSFYPNTTGALPHSSASCVHPAFNCSFNRSETMTKTSTTINHRTNYFNSPSPSSSSTRNREMSCSSASSTSSLHINDLSTSRKSAKSETSIDLKREAISPKPSQHSNRQPTPNSSPALTNTISPSIKQEFVDEDEDEDVDVEQHDPVPTPPITSSSPSSSPQSSSSILAKLNHLNNESLPFKIRSQFLTRNKHQPNDVTNTADKEITSDVNGIPSDTTRQIRYYHDRIDFRGDILYKPPAAKNCRILWEFLYILLEDPQYESIIHWEDRDKMVFRIIQADKLAALWGLQKNRLSMTYEKLSRGMRYYYSNNIISKEQSKRLLYRFMRSPDEIRKSMKRNGGTTSMVYSAAQKRNSSNFSSNINGQQIEMNDKSNLDNDDNSMSSNSSSSHLNHSSPSQISNPLLQFFSICPPSTATSILSNLNSSNALMFGVPPNGSSSQCSSPSAYEMKPNIICKTDRSNSSSPLSFDNFRDRSTDNEKQTIQSSQSLNSSSTNVSSSTASAKRKQSVPISLTARLSNQHQHHHSDQPLNLAVHKEENCSTDVKKIKVCLSPSNP